MRKACPCNGCDRRLVGCHTLCREYQQWRKGFEAEKAARREETPEMSRSMKRHIWRKMLGR